ncbi:MAG: Ig-like domain-containing protein [Luteibaculaceae bacterium]
MRYLFLPIFWLLSLQAIAQPCVRIEHVLVDACGSPEPANEMLRFKVGNNNLSVNNLQVIFPNSPFTGICQNENTASIVEQLNEGIGNCGLILEPQNGVLPAGSTVILAFGENFSPTAHSFANLAEEVYMIFQCGIKTGGGFLANWVPESGLRTITLNFGIGCNDALTYNRNLLVTQNGTPGAEDGAFVRRNPNTANGLPLIYGNNGCIPPFDEPNPFWVAPAFICQDQAPVNLMNLVNGSLNGFFIGPGITGNTFNPEGLLGPQEITYRISPSGDPNCTFDSTRVITVLPVLSPAWNPEPIACAESGFFDLNQRILGDSGGIFTGPLVNNNQLNLASISGQVSITYTVGSNGCTYSETHSIGYQESPPAPLITAVNGCEGESAPVLSASGSNSNFLWYSEADLQNLLFTGAAFSPPVNTPLTSVFVQAEQDDCLSEPTQALLVFDPIPPLPILLSDTIFCVTSAPFTLEASASGVIDWFNEASLQNTIQTGNSFSGTFSNGQNFWIVNRIEQCVSPPVNFSVEVLNAPPPPSILPAGNPCPGATIEVFAESDFEVFWFADAGLQQPLGSGLSFVTQPVTEPVTVFAANFLEGCNSTVVSTTINPNDIPLPQISAPDTLIVCNLTQVAVSVSNAAQVVWTDGSTVNPKIITQSGTYTVVASNICYEETFSVEVLFSSLSLGLSATITEALPPFTSRVNASVSSSVGFNTVEWILNDVEDFAATPLERRVLVNEVGDFTYLVTVTDNVGCSVEDVITITGLPETESNVYIPSAFTPNNDGLNDIFFVKGFGFTSFSLKIYDRWGNQIYSSNNPAEGWDGTVNGNPAPSGYYAFVVQIMGAEPRFIERKGSVLLLR